MEDILAVYKRPRDGDCPLVCLDEASKQLLADTRTLIPMKPGQPERRDYEYERNGTANLFIMFAPLEGWRRVKVTDRRTAVDYAKALEDLSDRHFPNAKKIVLVQDNLNTHKPASLYEAFPPDKARRLVERFEWALLHGEFQERSLGFITRIMRFSWRNGRNPGDRPQACDSEPRRRWRLRSVDQPKDRARSCRPIIRLYRPIVVSASERRP